MATYQAAAYGPNINAGVNVNADHDWGGHQFPNGVPDEMLGFAGYKGVRSQVREELVTLYSLAYQIAIEVHGYTIHTTNPDGSGEAWGPWGYENRTISGSSTPSNHSRGKANDWNAPNNGYADGFSNIVSDFPPAMVADIESIGLAWGGRYGDAMHWEYAYPTTDVAGHEDIARSILNSNNINPAHKHDTAPTEEEILMANIDDLTKEQKETNRLLAAAVEQLVANNQREQAEVDALKGIVEQQAAMNSRLEALVLQG